MTSAIVDFYYGVASRYSYLASTQTAGLEEETGCRARWSPICGRDSIRQGTDPFDGRSNYGDTLITGTPYLIAKREPAHN